MKTNRWSYEPAKTIWMFSIGWMTMGVPRLFGLMQVRPEYEAFTRSLDLTVVTLFGLATLYIFAAIWHNAKVETERSKQ